jgi:hypothetical protein
MLRAGAIQFGRGQQASSLRFGSTARARRLLRSEHGIAGADPAAKDAEFYLSEVAVRLSGVRPSVSV